MLDDDFKISMDDIKDMVSDLFGEKIEKIEKQKAKEILSHYTEELLLKDIEEEEITSKVEDEVASKIQEKEQESKGLVGEEETKKSIEDEIRKKVESELREKIKQEIEDERVAKRKELLKKLEESSKPAQQESAVEKKQVISFDFIEKLALINLFEQSQKVLLLMLAKLLKRGPAEKMFYKTLEKAIEKYPDVLRKVNCNQYSKPRMDGSMEDGRLAANINALSLSEDKKTDKMCSALHEIFEERLIAVELALGIETKNEIISNLIMQLDKIFITDKNKNKLMSVFYEKIIPDTTLKESD